MAMQCQEVSKRIGFFGARPRKSVRVGIQIPCCGILAGERNPSFRKVEYSNSQIPVVATDKTLSESTGRDEFGRSGKRVASLPTRVADQEIIDSQGFEGGARDFSPLKANPQTRDHHIRPSLAFGRAHTEG